MRSDRRTYVAGKDQPVQKRVRLHPPVPSTDPQRGEPRLYRSLDLEKFAADWRRGVGRRVPRG